MLQNHNIAWRKFYLLFLNIVKRGKGRETQDYLNSSFSHNFCRWLYIIFSLKKLKFYGCRGPDMRAGDLPDNLNIVK